MKRRRINGRYHPKGDSWGKPIGAQGASGCLPIILAAIALAAVAARIKTTG